MHIICTYVYIDSNILWGSHWNDIGMWLITLECGSMHSPHLLTPYSMMYDRRVSREGPVPFYWPKLLYTHKNLRVNLFLNDTQSCVKPFLWLNSHFKYTQSRVLLVNPRTLLPYFQGFYTRLRGVWNQIEKRVIACSFYTQIFVSDISLL